MKDISGKHFRNIVHPAMFPTISNEKNSVFACLRPTMDMKVLRGGGPSFLKFYGSVPLVLQAKDTGYSILWVTCEPNLHSRPALYA